MAHSRLHVISARCAARDLHTVAPGPLERTCWRQFGRCEEIVKKSRIAPLNAIIIIIVVVVIIIIIIIVVVVVVVVISPSQSPLTVGQPVQGLTL